MERTQPSAQSSASAEQAPAFALSPPQLSLPKGGGAMRGMGEKFAANPGTGAGSMSVHVANDIAVPPTSQAQKVCPMRLDTHARLLKRRCVCFMSGDTVN
jgi:hypothetical protein